MAMTPRQRYILDQAPGLLAAILGRHAIMAASDAVTAAVGMAGALYDQVCGAEAVPVGAASAATDQAAACPHQDIIALYHELLPMCPRVRSWAGARPGQLRARWREHPDLEWWRGYLTYVAESKFLTGRAEGGPGRRPFVADLEWLVTPSHMARIYEGKYHG